MKRLKKLFLKLLGRSYQNNLQNIESNSDIIAYFYVSITKNNEININGDFIKQLPTSAMQLAFLLSSGALADSIFSIIEEKYKDDPEIVLQILNTVQESINNYTKNVNDKNDDPVVDPCSVLGSPQANIQNIHEDFEE